MLRTGGCLGTTGIGLMGAAMWLLASVPVAGQEQFQFVVFATDASGAPVSELTVEDVVMSENGMPNQVVKVEPLKIPVKLTLAVDNGPLSLEALSHYRSGLAGLVEGLDADVEVEVITIAPQPRRVVRATKDREAINRGINGFAPEPSGSPKFTDALVEFSKRFQDEFNKNNRIDSIPVLVMISTTAPETSSYQVAEVSKALTFLRARRAKVYVSMISVRGDVQAFSQINTNRQALIALPAVESTGGKYEALAISNRLATLLPEWGQEIQAMHTRYNNQFVVTVQRRDGLTGALQNPAVELTRAGLNGRVAMEGVPPLTEMKQ